MGECNAITADTGCPGWPSYDVEDCEIDFAAELAEHLDPRDVAILFEVGANRHRYIIGQATAIHADGRSVSINIRDIYGAAAGLIEPGMQVKVVFRNAAPFSDRGEGVMIKDAPCQYLASVMLRSGPNSSQADHRRLSPSGPAPPCRRDLHVGKDFRHDRHALDGWRHPNNVGRRTASARGSRAHPSFADWVRVIRPEPWMGRATPLDVDEAASLETRRPGKAAETRLRTKV